MKKKRMIVSAQFRRRGPRSKPMATRAKCLYLNEYDGSQPVGINPVSISGHL
jgi:hypothetical protein